MTMSSVRTNEKLVEKIAEQEPDLILLDGDILNGDSSSAEVPVNLIARLKETAPVYYALGNHEITYMEQVDSRLTEELTAAGAVVLDKEYVDLEAGGVSIRLGGMYAYAFGPDRKTGENRALAAPADTVAFLREFQDTDRLKIMMSHRPDSFIFGDASEVWDVDLVVSAHDHGGRWCFRFSAACTVEIRLVSALYSRAVSDWKDSAVCHQRPGNKPGAGSEIQQSAGDRRADD